MTLIRAAVVGLIAAVAAPVARADDKPAKFDAEKVAGTYTLTAGVKDGKKHDAKDLKDLTLVVAKDTIELKSPDGTFKFGYKIDATKTPAAIDLEILDGPVGKGSKAKGIVALDGDTLKIAYHPMDGDRPKDFECKEGSGCFGFTAKKAAKKDK